MFKIVDFRNMDGKIRITIETDDSTTVLMLRFFSQADKFAELFHYRATTASRLESRQKNRPVLMAHAKEFRAEQLRQYRALPGNRNERLSIMKEMRAMIGQIVTLDRLGAELSVAIEEERAEKIERIILMRENGRSLLEISQELGIPTSTVRRYMQSYRKSPPTVNRDPAMVHNFPRRPSRGPKKKKPLPGRSPSPGKP